MSLPTSYSGRKRPLSGCAESSPTTTSTRRRRALMFPTSYAIAALTWLASGNAFMASTAPWKGNSYNLQVCRSRKRQQQRRYPSFLDSKAVTRRQRCNTAISLATTTPTPDDWLSPPQHPEDHNDYDDGGGLLLDAFLDDQDVSDLHNIPLLPDDDYNNSNNDDFTSDFSSTTTDPKNNLSFLQKEEVNSTLSYFYLRNEIGLSEDDMWLITTKRAPSLLGYKASTLRTKVQVLQSTMGFTIPELREVIAKQPAILSMSATKNLAPTILYLVRQLDLVPSTELKRLVQDCPSVLTYAISTLGQKLHFFRETLSLSKEDTRTMLLAEPRLLTSSPKTGLLPRYVFLLKEIDFPKEQLVSKVLMKNPSILLMSVQDNLQPKIIFYFIMTLHMRPSEVHKLLTAFPHILDYNLENHLLPITRYFLSLDVSAFEFAKMLLKFPKLVTNSLKKIKHVVGYLRYELGLEANDVRRVLYQCPQVCGMRTQTLGSKVDFLLETVAAPGSVRGEEASTDVLRRVIVGMPNLLKLSIDKNLAPKVEYLQQAMGGNDDGRGTQQQDQGGRKTVADAVVRLPTLLGYSLEKRIRPRMERLQDAGVDLGAITVGITMKEDDFTSWLENRRRKAELLTAAAANNPTDANPEETSKMEPQQDGKIGDKQTGKKERIKPPPIEEREVEEGGRVVHWKRR